MNMNKYILIGMLSTMGWVAFAVAKKPSDDFFRTIGAVKQEALNTFPRERIMPPDLPVDKILAFKESEPFVPTDKIDTEEEVKEALAALREEYTPFLQDFAPPIADPCKRVSISSMQFRLELPEDVQDFAYTLSGKGAWEQVRIPYYHGPTGPATAWYRAEVELTKEMLATDGLVLHFKGADYYTDAYVNGHHIGYHEGMLDPFEFNAKPYAKEGMNTVLVRLKNDFSALGLEDRFRRKWGNKVAASNCPGWDDPMDGWNCCPAGFGLYQDLYFETRSYTTIHDIFPRPLLHEKSVELWVETDLPNGNQDGKLTLKTSIYGQNFETVVVEDQITEIDIVGGRCRYKINIPIPEEKLRIWSPETPWLYQAQVELYDKTGAQRLDAMKRQFGMRSFVISETSTPKGRLYLNGKEIRLRGANTMGYLQKNVMAHDWDQLIDDLLLNKLTHINFIRTTQRSVQEEVYEYADRLGVMIQSDLPVFSFFTPKTYRDVIYQASLQERLLRSHPSVILLTYMNEPMAGMKPHALSRAEYSRIYDALDVVVHLENPDRAVKYVEGDFQPPNKGLPDHHCYNFWYNDWGVRLGFFHKGGWKHTKKDWMYSCGEFGGEGLDTVDLMMRCYPDQWLPENREREGAWHPEIMKTNHKSNQTGDIYWNWFEPQERMEDWVKRSREHQAWGVRMITESYRRQPRMCSFAIHLFIDAWPNGWMKAIVDCERKPKDAWYVYRDALTPLSVQLRSDRHAFFSGENFPVEVWVCNDTHIQPASELRYQIETDEGIYASGTVDAQVPSVTEGSQFQGFLPVVAPNTSERTTFTIRLGLFDKKSGEPLHETSRIWDLYPALEPRTTLPRIYLLGPQNEESKAVVDAFGLSFVTEGKIQKDDTIIVTDYTVYNQYRQEIDAAVKVGAKCVMLLQLVDDPKSHAPDEINELTIGSSAVSLEVRQKGYAYILCRNTDHPFMEETQPNDFKFWYSDKEKIGVFHKYRRFVAPDFTPVLSVRDKVVVAERSDGQGQWVLFQVGLDGRLINPSAKVLLDQILF